MILNELIKNHVNKVRYIDWPEDIKYMIIIKFNNTLNIATGYLSTGEVLSVPLDSNNWKRYEEGDEFLAKAI